MAKTRTCFARSICCSDDFLELSSDAQRLYFHLNFEADNDGVIDGMKKTLRAIGSSDAALTSLVESGYLLEIDDCFVIRDWCVHNKKDTHNYFPGSHQDIMAQLEQVSDRNRAYRLIEDGTDCPQTEPSLEPVSKLNKSNLNKNELNEPNTKESNQKKEKKETFSAPCPECGKPNLVTSSPPYYAVCDFCNKEYDVER